jgi:hypothetical protein
MGSRGGAMSSLITHRTIKNEAARHPELLSEAFERSLG